MLYSMSSFSQHGFCLSRQPGFLHCGEDFQSVGVTFILKHQDDECAKITIAITFFLPLSPWADYLLLTYYHTWGGAGEPLP